MGPCLPNKQSGINRLLRHLLHLDRAHAEVIVELALEGVTLGKHFLRHLRHLVPVCLPKFLYLRMKKKEHAHMFPNVALRRILYANLARETVF